MELKCRILFSLPYPGNVLIVPYGIEITRILPDVRQVKVLIVPYGIEILNTDTHDNGHKEVLIVPYGIEIVFREYYRIGSSPFNRTLWSSLKDKCGVCHSCF